MKGSGCCCLKNDVVDVLLALSLRLPRQAREGRQSSYPQYIQAVD